MRGPANDIKVAVVRLKGSRVSELVTPEGWRPENSASFHYAQPGDERYEFLREERGLFVYLDRETAKEVFGSVAPDLEK